MRRRRYAEHGGEGHHLRDRWSVGLARQGFSGVQEHAVDVRMGEHALERLGRFLCKLAFETVGGRWKKGRAGGRTPVRDPRGRVGYRPGRRSRTVALASLAGVTPSTRQSGKMKTTSFRWSADKQLRDAVCDFAADSRHANPWAAQLYQQARDRGHRHPHAVRIVARAWLHVIWRCWQDHQPYDPARHRALQTLLAAPIPPTEVAAA